MDESENRNEKDSASNRSTTQSEQQGQGTQTAPDHPIAYINNLRMRGIFAYGVRLHFNNTVTWHWGAILHTQPSVLQMLGLLRVLDGMMPSDLSDLRLRAILPSDYLLPSLLMAGKRKRDSDRGRGRGKVNRDEEFWTKAAIKWDDLGKGMREAQTPREEMELSLIYRMLFDMFLQRHPSPFGTGEHLVEGGDPLPFW